MSIESTQRTLAMVSTALEALEAIGGATRGVIASEHNTDTVLAIVRGIDAVVISVLKGLRGEASADRVEADLFELKNAFASNDAAADASVDAKFPQ